MNNKPAEDFFAELNKEKTEVKCMNLNLQQLEDDISNLLVAARNLINFLPLKEDSDHFALMHQLVDKIKLVEKVKERADKLKAANVANIIEILNDIINADTGSKAEKGSSIN